MNRKSLREDLILSVKVTIVLLKPGPPNKLKEQKQSSDVFCKKGVMKKLGKIQRKTPVLESLFNKVATRWFATLLKKKLLHTHFLLNFAKFFVTPFLQNTSGRLL